MDVWMTWHDMVGFEGRGGTPRCPRVLVREGKVRECTGPLHAVYLRRGQAGRFIRTGTVCRACGHFTLDQEPPLAGEREATPQEAQEWRRQQAHAAEQRERERQEHRAALAQRRTPGRTSTQREQDAIATHLRRQEATQ